MFRKRKRKNSFSFPLFLDFRPSPNSRVSRTSLPLASAPAQLCAAQHRRRPSIAATVAPPSPRPLTDRARLSAPPPTSLRASRNRPRVRLEQLPPAPGLLASWERPSPRLASLNRSPHPSRPPAAPLHSVFALASEFVIAARRSFADAVRRLLPRTDRRRRATPSSFFPAVRTPRHPSISRYLYFLVSWLLEPWPRAPRAMVAGHGGHRASRRSRPP